MSFEAVTLKWGDAEYVIPPEKTLGAIARVEDIITLDELIRFQAKSAVPRAKLAQAFGSVLRYAGARVADSDIYEGMFGIDKEKVMLHTIEATNALLALMLPPSAVAEANSEAEQDPT